MDDRTGSLAPQVSRGRIVKTRAEGAPEQADLTRIGLLIGAGVRTCRDVNPRRTHGDFLLGALDAGGSDRAGESDDIDSRLLIPVSDLFSSRRRRIAEVPC